jgi:hypothetical protein
MSQKSGFARVFKHAAAEVGSWIVKRLVFLVFLLAARVAALFAGVLWLVFRPPGAPFPPPSRRK